MRLAAALTLLALPAVAQEDDPSVAAAAAAGLTCQPGGYEITLRNDGPLALPEGTVIGWNVPFARMDGTHTLTRAFEPGTTVMLSAVLGSNYVNPGKPCITSLPPVAAE